MLYVGGEQDVVWHPPKPDRSSPKALPPATPAHAWATTLGSDVLGFVANAVAPVAEVGYYLAKGLACSAAPAVGCEDLATDLDDPFTEVFRAVENVQSGVVQFSGREEPWFKRAGAERLSWLAEVPDHVPLTSLVLPGTHRSLSLFGGAMVECQKWPLERQLQAGIRAVDLRFGREDDEWVACHGVLQQRDTFARVAQVLESFVLEQPTETLLVRLEDESFEGGFRERVNRAFGSGLWVRAARTAVLGDLRGRIVLLDDEADVQDSRDEGDHARKWDKVRSHALQAREPGTLYVSFASAAGRDGLCRKTPAGMAFHVNKELLDFAPRLLAGVYFVDFPGQGLLNAIIARNGGEHPTWQL